MIDSAAWSCLPFLWSSSFKMPGGLHPPIDVIFSWTPNYIDPPNRGWGMVILVAGLLTFAYVVVAMRLWARFVLAKNAGLDDALIMFNMVRKMAEASLHSLLILVKIPLT